MKKILAIFLIIELLTLFIKSVPAQYVTNDNSNNIYVVTVSNEEPFLLDVNVIENTEKYIILGFEYSIRPNTNGTYLDKLKQPTLLKFADLTGNLDVKEINVDGIDVTNLFTLESKNYTRNFSGNNFNIASNHNSYIKLDKSSKEIGLLISFGTGSTSVYVTETENVWRITSNYTHSQNIDVSNSSGQYSNFWIASETNNKTLGMWALYSGLGTETWSKTTCSLREDGPIRARIYCENTAKGHREDIYCYHESDHLFCNRRYYQLSSGPYHLQEAGNLVTFCGTSNANWRVDSCVDGTWDLANENAVCQYSSNKYYFGYKRDDCDALHYHITSSSTCQYIWWYYNQPLHCRDNANNVYLSGPTWMRDGTTATQEGMNASSWIDNENFRWRTSVTTNVDIGSVTPQIGDQIRLNVTDNEWKGSMSMKDTIGYLEVGNFTIYDGIYVYNSTVGTPGPNDLRFAVYYNGTTWNIKEAGSSGCSPNDIIGIDCNVVQIEDVAGQSNWYMVFPLDFTTQDPTQHLYIKPPNKPPYITNFTVVGAGKNQTQPANINTNITFKVDWIDPNPGDETRIFICPTPNKTDSQCSGTELCYAPPTGYDTTSPKTCSWNVGTQDDGTAYAFICDDEEACSDIANTTNYYINHPPIIGEEFRCYNLTDWTQCNTTSYNDIIAKVKTQCTDIDGNIANVKFTLKELYDDVTDFLYEEATDMGGDWWEFDNINLRINNSGDFLIFANCTDANDLADSNSITWTIPWGSLEVTNFTVTPTSITLDDTFTVTATIRCNNGECGDINSTLSYETITGESYNVSTIQDTAPMWTSDLNPNNTCINMKKSGENKTCTMSWTITATEEGRYNMFTVFSPINPNVQQIQSDKRQVNLLVEYMFPTIFTYPFDYSNEYIYDSSKIEVKDSFAQLIGSGIVIDAYAVYHLNEETGTTVSDSSGNGRNGTTVNMTDANWVTGKLSNALQFDGVDEYVNFGDIADFEYTDSFSLEAWINTSTDTTTIMAKELGGPSYQGIILQIAAGKIHFTLMSDFATLNYAQIYADNIITDGSWHHVIVTYNGNSAASGMKIYIDGSLTTPIVNKDNLSANITNNADFTIGQRISTEYFNGLIDEAIIYERELNQTEVTYRYDNSYGREWTGELEYPTDNPTIIPKTPITTGITLIKNWTSFEENATKNSGEIYYQLSDDNGKTWKYWDDSEWTTANTTQYNPADEINNHISSFSTINKQLLFKAFLSSNGTQFVRLDTIEVGYNTWNILEAIYNYVVDIYNHLTGWITSTLNSILGNVTDIKSGVSEIKEATGITGMVPVVERSTSSTVVDYSGSGILKSITARIQDSTGGAWQKLNITIDGIQRFYDKVAQLESYAVITETVMNFDLRFNNSLIIKQEGTAGASLETIVTYLKD